MHSLRTYQREALDALVSYLHEHKGTPGKNPLIIAPTGSGKSHIISSLIEKYAERVRFLVLAHRKELCMQNAGKVSACLQHQVGVYCAGLGRKDVGKQITFGTIASCYKKADLFKDVKVLIIDEAHLIPKKGLGMFRTLIEALLLFQPGLRILGLTATPYRLDSGPLVGEIFTDEVFDIDTLQLVKEGYLAPIVSKGAVESVDSSTIKVRAGEFVAAESEELFLKVVDAQAQEIVRWGEGRKSWLLFCSGVTHAEKITEALNRNGIKARCVTGKTAKDERAGILESFKAGSVTALVNVDVLTTGFDAPNVDLLAILRPTQSTGLYVQIVGRGMRICEGKKDCLLLDFGENIERHGPIGAIRLNKKSAGNGEAAAKICPSCREANKIDAKRCEGCSVPFTKQCSKCNAKVSLEVAELLEQCPECNHYWKVRNVGNARAGSEDPMSKERVPAWYLVRAVDYKIHQKEGKPDSLRVTYELEGDYPRWISEYICIQHGGYATRKAIEWCHRACPENLIPQLTECQSTAELHAFAENFKEPSQVLARTENGFWRVLSYDYTPMEKEDESLPQEWNEFLREINI